MCRNVFTMEWGITSKIECSCIFGMRVVEREGEEWKGVGEVDWGLPPYHTHHHQDSV